MSRLVLDQALAQIHNRARPAGARASNAGRGAAGAAAGASAAHARDAASA